MIIFDWIATAWNAVWPYLVAVLVLFSVIIIHEFGHFLLAKLNGIRVNEFALGFGPRLLHKKIGETDYALRLIPFGGFCAMEGEDAETGDPRAFTAKPAWQRAIVLCAGAAYRPIVSGGHELWVLTANAPQTYTVDESDKFRIDGADGEPMIEIVRGDRRTVPATVSAVSTSTGHFTVTFNVVSDIHPTIEACTNLVERDWQSESSEDFPGSVSWSGSSGAWIADIATDADALFVQGFYELGSTSYLKLMGERYTPGITTGSDPVATPLIDELDTRVDALEDALGDIATALQHILGDD